MRVPVPERAYGVKWFPERFFAHSPRRKPGLAFLMSFLRPFRSWLKTHVLAVEPAVVGLFFGFDRRRSFAFRLHP